MALERQSTYVSPENNRELNEYSDLLNNFSKEELLNDYFTESRYRLFGLYGISTRKSDIRISKNWYTTTCYLSGKINIMLFVMLCIFYNHKGIYIHPHQTEFIVRWSMIEYMMWELLTTNSVNTRSEPPSLAYVGQRAKQPLNNILDESILPTMVEITSVSNGRTDYSTTLDSLSDISPYQQVMRLLNSTKCDSLDMSILLGGIKSPRGGVIHWFCFQLYDNRLYILSTWADGDAGIQSIIQRTEVSEEIFNNIVLGLMDGSPDIDNLREYFFKNSINEKGESVDPISYLSETFNTPGFTIIVYGDYTNKVMELGRYLYDKSYENDSFGVFVKNNIQVYTSGHSLPLGMEPFKLFIDRLFSKINTSPRDDVGIIKPSKSRRSVKYTRKTGPFKRRTSLGGTSFKKKKMIKSTKSTKRRNKSQRMGFNR